PLDITGTEVIQEDRQNGVRVLNFLAGPIFGNIMLADEISCHPPKTQAAILEATQEHQYSVAVDRHMLADPVFLLAAQNRIEQEGTYPLPEAQLDRFMFNVRIDYPSEEEELQIVKQTTADVEAKIEPTLGAAEILALQKIVRRVPVADHVARYALQFARRSRP